MERKGKRMADTRLGGVYPAVFVPVIRAAVDDLNGRMTKKGLTGRVALDVSDPIPDNDPNRLTVVGRVRHEVRLDITGVFRVPGYTFRGAYEFVPGSDGPPLRFRFADGWEHPETVTPDCDHCGFRRDRRTVFVLESDDGVLVTVGSTCLRDFTGHDPAAVLGGISWLESEWDDIMEPFAARAMDIPTVEYVTAAVLATDANGGGYNPTSGYGYATRDWATDICYSPTDLWEAYANIDVYRNRAAMVDTMHPTDWERLTVYEKAGIDRVRAVWATAKTVGAEARAEAERAIAWATELDPIGNGTDHDDFRHNLRVTASLPFLSRRAFGVAAYIPTAYRRAMGRAEARRRAAEAKAAATPVVAANGVAITGTVISLKWYESRYGDTLKTTVATDDGHTLWGTLPRVGHGTTERGDRVRFVANVVPSTRGDDPAFGLFKRPRKWENLGREAE